MFPIAAAFSLLAIISAQPLTIQPCSSKSPEEVFGAAPWASNTPRDGLGSCLTVNSSASGAPVFAAPCTGADAQRWLLHADGTVESVAHAGSCWNVWSGETAVGTPIALFACGEVRGAVAANDVFVSQLDGTLLAQESGLCVSSVAVPPPPPPPPGVCSDEWDCSLNGECRGGVCACNAPWTATLNCEALAFAPTPPVRGFPPPGHNETTWGGSIALDSAGGLYHMYVAEMMNECPLNTWGQNSRCTHAVASAPEGPYVFADVAVQNWCHNPAIVTQAFGNGTTLWALFHIGDGTGGDTSNCSAGAREGSAAGGGGGDGGSTLHVAYAPGGPFLPAPPLPRCNNPAPWLMANGTWLIVCEGFQLWRADTVWGPWAHVTTIRSSAGTPIPGAYEDPFFFVDAQGRFHVIYHVYRTGADAHNCLPGHDGAVVSGHYFSMDGFTWRASSVAPYGNVVNLTDGTAQLLTTRERPKMLFNAAGQPTHLSNGVCPSPGNWNTPIACPEVSTGCVDCKYNDWDFTNVSPLMV